MTKVIILALLPDDTSEITGENVNTQGNSLVVKWLNFDPFLKKKLWIRDAIITF